MSKYNFTARKLIMLLNQNGFLFVRQNGSHAVFRNYLKKRKVVVPIHSKDIPNGTVRGILKDAEIKI